MKIEEFSNERKKLVLKLLEQKATQQAIGNARGRTAYHEAGHAVIMYALGAKIEEICVTRDGKYAGYVTDDFTLAMDWYKTNPAFTHIISLLAGIFSTHKAYPNDGDPFSLLMLGIEASSDIDKILNYLKDLSPDADMHRVIDGLRGFISTLVDNTTIWSMIVNLANRLFEKGDMNGRDFQLFIDSFDPQGEIRRIANSFLTPIQRQEEAKDLGYIK